MNKKTLLQAIVAGLSLCASTWCLAQVAPDSPPTLTLSGIELRLPLSKVLPKEYLFWAGARPSDLKIDYLKSDPPHASFSALAAEAVTVGGLCHVARLHPNLQIVQSCPAQRDTQTRLKAWRDFLSGKRKQLPPGAQVHVVRNGTDIFPVVGAELQVKLDTLNQILNRKIPILTKISPPCQFPPSANGKKITELCARSLPVPIPDFSASIKEIDRWKGELVLTRLMPGPSSALLALQVGTKPQVRVQVNVEAPTCEFEARRYGFGSAVTAFAASVVPQGGKCTGIPLVCAPENRPVPLRGRWVNKEDNIEFSPSGLFSSCRVDSPPPPPSCQAGQTLYQGDAFLDFDKDDHYSKRAINHCLTKNNISGSLGTVSWQERGGPVIMWGQHPVFPATGNGPTGKTEPPSGDTNPNSPRPQSSSLPQSQSSSSEETLGPEVEFGRPKEVEVTACGDGKVEGREECEDDLHCAAHQLEQVGRLSGMKCVDCVCVEPTCGNGKKDDTEECDESTPDGTAGDGGIGSSNFQCEREKICVGCKCYNQT
jgi:hypothetical protein